MALQLPSSFITFSDGDGRRRKGKPRKTLIHLLIDGIRFMTSDRNSDETLQLIVLPHLEYLAYQGFCFYDCADYKRHSMPSPQHRAWHLLQSIPDTALSSSTPTVTSPVSPFVLEHASITTPMTLSYVFGLTNVSHL